MCEPKYFGHMCRNLGGWACFEKTKFACCLGKTTYDVVFRDSYGHQTVIIVSDCKSICDKKNPLHHSKILLQPSLEGALEGDEMTFPNLWCASHDTPPLLDGHDLCNKYRTCIVFSLL